MQSTSSYIPFARQPDHRHMTDVQGANKTPVAIRWNGTAEKAPNRFEAFSG